MTKIERAKLLVETGLLCVAIIYGAAFAWRTWPFPSAKLELIEKKRVTSSDRLEAIVLVQATLALGDKSNFDISLMQPQCRILDSTTECKIECPESNRLLAQGRLSAGDSFSWSCIVKDVPISACAFVSLEVTGSAPLPVWGDSRWWTTLISCPSILEKAGVYKSVYFMWNFYG